MGDCMQERRKKAKRPELSAVPEGADSVRLADALTFIEIYEKANAHEVEGRENFSTLLSHPSQDNQRKGLTTRISQLERIVEFLYGKGEPERTGLHRLFEKDAFGALIPSDDSRIAYKHFIVLRDMYRNIKKEFEDERSKNAPTVLRVGAPQIIGMRLLASIFSDRQRLLPDGLRLEIEIANSHDLIRRLKARLLDVVIAYGPKSMSGTTDPLTDLAFRSLDYCSRMVLLCPPASQLYVRTGKANKLQDANLGYWDEFKGRRGTALPSYERLRPIDLDKIDFVNTRLIVVDSWQQPEFFEAFIRKLPPDRVIRAGWYDEALAMVRMGEGIAVAAEVFSRRVRVNVFSLSPEEEFQRWIGAYFHPPEERLPNHTKFLINVIRTYLNRFDKEIHGGDPPAFGDEKYEKFCDEVALIQN